MNEGNPMQEKLEDISWIKDECHSYYESASDYNHFSFSTSQSTAVLIFCTYLFLNILILIFTVLYLGKVFTWIEQPQQTYYLKSLYKASAIVLTWLHF